MKKLLTLSLLLFILILYSTAQPGALDLSFNSGTGANNQINAMALQPDGKIVAVGYFDMFNGDTIYKIIRLNTDGSIDTSFHSGTQLLGANVLDVTLQPDGKIIAAGEIGSYAGVTSNFIVRLNADASLDTSFHTGTGFSYTVHCIKLQSDGKILVGGEFTSYNGITANRIIRLNTDGSADTSFHSGLGADGTVEAIALQPDGKIVIGGDLVDYNGLLVFRTTRLFADGTHDSTFHATGHPTAIGLDGAVFDIAITPQNRIYVGGNFNNIAFQSKRKIGRLLPNGDLDAAFSQNGTGANNEVRAVKLSPQSKVLMCGNFGTYNNTSIVRVARLDSAGQIDTEFDPGTGPDGEPFNLSLQPDGKIIICGSFDSYNGTARGKIARLYNCLTPQPDSIYGNSYALCNGTQQTYSITPVSNATKYEWTLPNGWLGSSDSASITITSDGSGGVISVKAFNDTCGYSYATTRTIATVQPPGVNICLVTVDTASTHNIVIWEKPQTALIDSFIIYRETATNVYTKIGAVPYDSLSEYHDYAADPNTTSYRYKLSVLDTCHAESDLSLFHNTIHLQNLGSGNFQWTFYQIENSLNPVLSFNVYRDNLGNGNFQPIGNVPGTNATFTDVTFNSFTNSQYVIDANWSISCTPSRTVNTTRSNIRHRNAIDVLSNGNELSIADMLQVYPNPAGKLVNISIPSSLNIARLQLFNAIGQIVWSETPVQTSSIKQINVETLPKGVYALSLETNWGRVIKKLIIE